MRAALLSGVCRARSPSRNAPGGAWLPRWSGVDPWLGAWLVVWFARGRARHGHGPRRLAGAAHRPCGIRRAGRPAGCVRKLPGVLACSRKKVSHRSADALSPCVPGPASITPFRMCLSSRAPVEVCNDCSVGPLGEMESFVCLDGRAVGVGRGRECVECLFGGANLRKVDMGCALGGAGDRWKCWVEWSPGEGAAEYASVVSRLA